MKEELLRDYIVVGIRDKALSEKIQLNPDFTLERAKKEIRQKEAVREQANQLQGVAESQVMGIHQRRPPPSHEKRKESQKYVRPLHHHRGGSSGKLPYSGMPSLCSRCGRSRHEKGYKCPAANAAQSSCDT